MMFSSPNCDVDAAADENVFPVFRQRLDAVSDDSPSSFFPFQCKTALKRQDALDVVSSPKIEDLLLRASQMKIRASPAQNVLKSLANALSPNE